MNVSKKYYINSSDESILQYLNSQIRVFKEMNSLNSELISKFLFPEIFGVIDTKLVSDLESYKEMSEVLEKLILSSLKNPHTNSKLNMTSSMITNNYKSNFFKKYPSYEKLFQDLNSIKTSEQKTELAQAIYSFYFEITFLAKDEQIIVFRNLLTNSENE